MTDTFSGYAGNYDEALARGLSLTGEGKEYFAQQRVSWLARTLAKLDKSSDHVLDFGCGTGSTSAMLLQLPGALEVLGVDVSVPLLDVAIRHHESQSVRFASVTDEIPEAAFDVVHCSGVFHHIPPAERPAAARWIRDRLRPGGVLALWENNPWNPGTRLVMSRIPFDRDAIRISPPQACALVRNAGLRIVATEYLFLWPRSLAFLRTTSRYLGWFPLGAQYLIVGKRS